jgi:hypothetical protein
MRQGTPPAQALSAQAEALSQALNKVMHRFGRQRRGQGKIFVKLVRETEHHLLALGESIAAWTLQARECLHQDHVRSQAQRECLLRDLEATRTAHRHITKRNLIKVNPRLCRGTPKV